MLENPLYYVKTSGTTGKSKLIPIYNKNTNILYVFFNKNIIYNLVFGKISFFMLTDKLEYYDSIEVSNAVTREFITIFNKSLLYYPLKYISTTPFDLYKSNRDMRINLLYALLNKNLTIIFSYFLRSALENLDNIFNNINYYIEAIEIGKIIINNEFYYFPKDVCRANELKNINKDPKNWIKKVWKNFKMIICGASGIYNLYKPRIKYYCEDVIIFSPFCACTEIIYGLSYNMFNDEYTYNKSQGILHLDKELEVDNRFYRVKITTYALKNYLIDDLIRFIDSNTFVYEGRYDFYKNTQITEREFSFILTDSYYINYIYDALLIKRDYKYILVVETYNNRKLPEYIINNLRIYINIEEIIYIQEKFNKLIDYILEKSSNKILFREQIKLPRILDVYNDLHLEYINILDFINKY